ncbi:MAG: hypothetical protein KJ057_15545 [Phycisphaerae bacterium]|nr:MAG: hypothetical protein EDS66_09920 [Planctomycetota bacterium]KAB2946003.1 MAG: hypothetical protein F9K17_09105 [Phycisphaerae bacterium]MBE7456226.1 hypothetical protein [Planctomycetia bacterium]MCK6464775.1 hypothetical protein [Phycisphaerae bacterium]MCL4719883.1 hypothetical protein [Phycisphaerae bacterium]
MTVQDGFVIAAVAAAALYLGCRAVRTLQGRGCGCADGDCSKTKSSQRAGPAESGTRISLPVIKLK